MTHKLSDADLRRMADELRAMDPGRWDDLLLASHVMATFKRFQWQPIETAPRIELAELILWNGKIVCAGSWWQTVDSSGLPGEAP